MSDNLNRVFLWCVPRTISTALLKCLSFVEGVQVVHEPYECAFLLGPERKSLETKKHGVFEQRCLEFSDLSNLTEGSSGYDESLCTYSWVRDELLGAPYEDKKILLCKEMAFNLSAKYHMLPKGFKYSFLIRHPAKVFVSWKTGFMKLFGDVVAQEDELLLQLPEGIFPAGYGFKELYELVEYVEKNLGQEAVIIDTDDLLSDPPGILSAYCLKMGIPYSSELLSWEAGPGITEKWIYSRGMLSANAAGGFYDAAFQSSGFKPPTPRPPAESLPADVQACVSASMGYYEELHERRLKASTTS